MALKVPIKATAMDSVVPVPTKAQFQSARPAPSPKQGPPVIKKS